MKQTVVVASLLAASALAKPLAHKHHKRDWASVEETDTAWTTVTASGSGSWGSWDGGDGSSGWGNWNSASTAEAIPAVTETPVVTEALPADVVTVWVTEYGPSPSPAASSPAAEASTPEAASSWSSASTSLSAGPSQGTGPGGVDITQILYQHNAHRQNTSGSVTAPALTWSTDMANIAAEIAASCVYAHNTEAGGGGYGQNIGAGSLPSDVPAMITNEMYNNEINYYPLPYGDANPDMSEFEMWGHYSQIMWASTTSVGCATQYCPGGLANTGSDVSPYFTVCNYSPPGNYGGEYNNVPAPGSDATITV